MFYYVIFSLGFLEIFENRKGPSHEVSITTIKVINYASHRSLICRFSMDIIAANRHSVLELSLSAHSISVRSCPRPYLQISI